MKHAAVRIRNQEIVAASNAGQSANDLAAAHGISEAYVRLLASKNAVPSAAKLRVLKRRAIVSELHSLDIPGGVAREMLGMPISIWQGDIRLLGLKFRSGTTRRIKGQGATKKRAERMCAMYRSGMTLQQIGERHGISRERVRQLMTKHLGISHKDGGQSVTGKANRQRSKAARDARYLRDYGCTFDQYAEVRTLGRAMVAEGHSVYATPLRAFAQQRNNAGARGIGWEMNFWQWWTIWQESGKWSQRGLAKHSYVMSRFMDTGPYAVGNVVICTLSENSSAQPNNPYRKDHPEHSKVEYSRRQSLASRDWSGFNRVHDLPRGVTLNRGRYQAQARLGGKHTYLGSFGTPEEAHAAYVSAVTDYVNAAHKKSEAA